MSLLKQIATELGCTLEETEYRHILVNPQYQLQLAGVEKYGNGKFKPDTHDRIEVTVHCQHTALGNSVTTHESATMAVSRGPVAIAKDIDRKMVAAAKAVSKAFVEQQEAEQALADSWAKFGHETRQWADQLGFEAKIGSERIHFYGKKWGSYRYFTATFDRRYKRFSASLTTDSFVPFVVMAEGCEVYHPISVRPASVWDVEYRTWDSVEPARQLFDTYLRANGFVSEPHAV